MKKNIYDYIISELVYRTSTISSLNSPYLEISSDLPFNDKAPFTLNTNVIFTSTLKNIPTGYNIKANTHIISYPIAVTPDQGSTSSLVGSTVPIIFSSIGDTFTVNVTITLEKPSLPDIVITGTFTISAIGAIYFGLRPVNNNFVLPGLASTTSLEINQKIYLTPSVNNYLYIVFPNGGNLPIFFRDQNGLIISVSDFTATVLGSYTYLVLNWSTSIPPFTKWEIVYNY